MKIGIRETLDQKLGDVSMGAQPEAYLLAQRAIADLKAAVLMALEFGQEESMGRSNAEIGRCLGIYLGHKGHEGHISRTMLALLEAEGLVEQDMESKRWKIRDSNEGG